jgi:hypothetical protein
MRSAEQRWPALSNAERSRRPTTCSGSAELSTIIAFWPPGLRDQHGIVARLASCAD